MDKLKLGPLFGKNIINQSKKYSLKKNKFSNQAGIGSPISEINKLNRANLIDPITNPIINSITNTGIKPDINTGIKPDINTGIKPDINTRINTGIKPDINPEITTNINPTINSEINVDSINNCNSDTSSIVFILLLLLIVIISFLLTKFLLEEGNNQSVYIHLLLWAQLVLLIIAFISLIVKQYETALTLFIIQYICNLVAQIFHQIMGNVNSTELSIASYIANAVTLIYSLTFIYFKKA